MCLSKITNRHKKDEGIGYKAFAIAIDGNLHSECRDTHTIRPINKWLKSIGLIVSSFIKLVESPTSKNVLQLFLDD